MGLGIDPELLEASYKALGRFIATANKNGETYYNCPENNTALRNKLKELGYTVEQWASEDVWAVAEFRCRTEGLLIDRPPAKTQAEINREREMRDRHAGSLAGNKNSDEETATSKFIKTMQGAKQRIEDEVKEASDKAAEERNMKERPWEYAPSFKVELSVKEQYAMNRHVYRWWLAKRNNWLRTQAQEEAKREAEAQASEVQS